MALALEVSRLNLKWELYSAPPFPLKTELGLLTEDRIVQTLPRFGE